MFPGTDTEKNRQFIEILDTYREARKIVNFKLDSDPINKNIWSVADKKLTQIKDILDKRLVPTSEQKNQLNLGIMLTKTLDPNDSQELEPLFKLSHQFDMLGIKSLTNDEALNLYHRLHSSR